ncbi:MAG: hypothetical protein GY897_21055 [Alteromonas sp.]|nr:hypothetical protein [Alteromonas sp.]
MKLLIGLLWMATVLCAYWYGTSQVNSHQSVGPGSVNSLTDAAEPKRLNGAGSTVLPVDAETGEGAVTTTESAHKPVTVDDALAKIESLLSGMGWSPTMASIAKAYAIVSQLNLEQTLAALNQMENTDSPENLQITMLFINRLAELSPLQAVDYVNLNVTGSMQKDGAMAAVIATWADSDPHAALQWYLSQPEATRQQAVGRFALGGLFSSLARQDLDAAISSIETDFDANDFEAIDYAVSSTARSLQNTEDFEYLLDRVQAMDNDSALQAVFSSWLTKDPDEALARLDLISDPKQRQAIEERAFRNWMVRKPAEAADRFMQRAAPDQRQSRAKVVVESMSFNQPEQALSWLNRQTDIDTQPLTSELISRSAYRNPQFADQNLHRITNQDNLTVLTSRIYQSYGRYSQAKADEFLSRQSPAVREQVLTRLKRVEEIRSRG